jgi:hypothetical protein
MVAVAHHYEEPALLHHEFLISVDQIQRALQLVLQPKNANLFLMQLRILSPSASSGMC